MLVVSLVLLVSCKPLELTEINLARNAVTIQVADTTIKAGVQDVQTATSLGYTYYWFENGKINKSQGAYTGKLLHGQFKSYHTASKRLLELGMFDRGLKIGSWLSWYDNGNLRRKSEYTHGLMDGSTFLFDSAGKPSDTLKYRKGQLKVSRMDTLGIYQRIKKFLKFRKK